MTDIAALQHPETRSERTSARYESPHRLRGDEVESGPLNSSVGDDLSFGDLLDLINPLQHIPVIGDIYRGISGDSIRPDIKMMGGALYGGPMGLVAGLTREIVMAEVGQQQVSAQTTTSAAADMGQPPPLAHKADSTAITSENHAPSGQSTALHATGEQTAFDDSHNLIANAEANTVEDLILRGLTKYDAFRNQAG